MEKCANRKYLKKLFKLGVPACFTSFRRRSGYPQFRAKRAPFFHSLRSLQNSPFGLLLLSLTQKKERISQKALGSYVYGLSVMAPCTVNVPFPVTVTVEPLGT